MILPGLGIKGEYLISSGFIEPGLLFAYSFASLIFFIFINSFKLKAPSIFPVRSVIKYFQ